MRTLQRTQPGSLLAQLAFGKAFGAFIAATLGAMAVGAVAIGGLSRRDLSAKSTRRSRVSIDDLTIRRLRVREFVRDDVPPPPIR